MRIIVGKGVDGFVSTGITSHELLHATNSTVVVYMDSTAEERFSDYYKGIKAVLQNNNNSLLVLLDTKSNSLINSTTNLCLLYGCYSVYKLSDVAQLSKNYINELLERKPTLEEVQMYVSIDSATEDAMGECIIRLSELCRKVDDVAISDFVMENLTVLLQMPAVFDRLKAYEDPTNKVVPEEYTALQEELDKARQELQQTIDRNTEMAMQFEDCTNALTQVQKDLDSQTAKVKTLETQNDDYRLKLGGLSEENTRLQGQINKGGVSGFEFYTPLATNSITGSKVKLVIYFKEISRPRYFNSFVTYLIEFLTRSQKRRVKMLIYDMKKDYTKLYGNLVICNQETFFNDRVNVIAQDKLVITDTNPAYLNEIFTTGEHDVCIVVDRLGKHEDLLTGVNVIKFNTFASRADYENYRQNYKKLDVYTSILSLETNITGVINIPKVDKYPNSSNARFTTYARLSNDVADESYKKAIYNLVLSKCGLIVD